jgi:hypothetical protein
LNETFSESSWKRWKFFTAAEREIVHFRGLMVEAEMLEPYEFDQGFWAVFVSSEM